MKSSVTRVLGDLNSKLREIEQRNQDIAHAKEEIDDLKRKKSQILEVHGDGKYFAIDLFWFYNVLNQF